MANKGPYDHAATRPRCAVVRARVYGTRRRGRDKGCGSMFKAFAVWLVNMLGVTWWRGRRRARRTDPRTMAPIHRLRAWQRTQRGVVIGSTGLARGDGVPDAAVFRVQGDAIEGPVLTIQVAGEGEP